MQPETQVIVIGHYLRGETGAVIQQLSDGSYIVRLHSRPYVRTHFPAHELAAEQPAFADPTLDWD